MVEPPAEQVINIILFILIYLRDLIFHCLDSNQVRICINRKMQGQYVGWVERYISRCSTGNQRPRNHRYSDLFSSVLRTPAPGDRRAFFMEITEQPGGGRQSPSHLFTFFSSPCRKVSLSVQLKDSAKGKGQGDRSKGRGREAEHAL